MTCCTMLAHVGHDHGLHHAAPTLLLALALLCVALVFRAKAAHDRARGGR